MSGYLDHYHVAGAAAFVRFTPSERWHRILAVEENGRPWPLRVTTLCSGSGEITEVAQLSAICLDGELCGGCRGKGDR